MSADGEATSGVLTTVHDVRLIVCTSCRDHAAREAGITENRAGLRLHTLLATRPVHGVELVGYSCLSGCKRACAFALQAAGKWSYVFGDCAADDASVSDILDCASHYRDRPDGFLERRRRPLRLQNGILARVPPLPTTAECLDAPSLLMR